MLARLDGHLIRQLNRAILDGFTHAELKQFVRTSLDARLEEISLNATGLADVVVALISWAERRFRIPELLDGLVQERPSVAIFGHLRAEIGNTLKGDASSGWSIDAEPPADPLGDSPGVEPAAIVRWAESMYRAARGVCLVEVGDVAATGFAIGPRLVLTAHVALAGVIDGTRDPRSVRVRFGWATGVPDEPPALSLWELDDSLGIIDSDATLGFALLLLGPPGEPEGGPLTEQMEGLRADLTPVHPLTPTSVAPKAGDPLYLLGHPLGGPLRMERLTAVAGSSADTVNYQLGLRQPGRSGAPILDDRQRVVGLHRGVTNPAASGPFDGHAVSLASILNREKVHLARMVSRDPPQRALEQMAI